MAETLSARPDPGTAQHLVEIQQPRMVATAANSTPSPLALSAPSAKSAGPIQAVAGIPDLRTNPLRWLWRGTMRP